MATPVPGGVKRPFEGNEPAAKRIPSVEEVERVLTRVTADFEKGLLVSEEHAVKECSLDWDLLNSMRARRARRGSLADVPLADSATMSRVTAWIRRFSFVNEAVVGRRMEKEAADFRHEIEEVARKKRDRGIAAHLLADIGAIAERAGRDIAARLREVDLLGDLGDDMRARVEEVRKLHDEMKKPSA